MANYKHIYVQKHYKLIYAHKYTFSAELKVKLRDGISINPWGRVVIAEHKKG